MENRFLSLIESSENPVLFDGAMGTILHNRGEKLGRCFDALNLSKPSLITEIHRDYIEAGAQVITTNTFGANHFKLAEHDLEERLDEINCAGAQLAKQAAESASKEVLIAGDVGPLGVRLAPFGRVKPEQARAAFREQIEALCNCNVLAAIIIETISDLYEIREAILAAREVCDLPVLASMTFTRDDRTLLGDSPAKVAQIISETGADVIGINCSSGPAQVLRILKKMRQAVPDSRYSVMPNAGWPEQVGGRIMYSAGAAYFGDYALAYRHEGVSIIGGCCGTTPEHIAAMREALDTTPPEAYANDVRVQIPARRQVEIKQGEPSQLAQKIGAGKFVVSVEMDPPRGLSIHKMQAGASLLADAGADVINVADSPMARMRMSPWAVCDLIQRNVGIETTLHFPTRGRNLLRVQGDLLAAHAIGVRNVFVVMGDPTEIGDYPEAMDNYDLSPSGLIKLIKKGFNVGVDHAGMEIGEPTNFFIGCALNLNPKDPQREIKVLRRKLKNGADFFLTQPVYEPEIAQRFISLYEEEHGRFDKPILVGVLPLYSVRHARFLHNEVPGISISKEMFARLEKAGKDAPQEGIKIAGEIIEQLKSWAQGVYLMPAFSRFEIAAEIIEVIGNQSTR
ncbi:MAG: bifunctional homocysteine S-methyltransferase/methylenetetrahydrofolate reductase [Anaerolineales bacterium]